MFELIVGLCQYSWRSSFLFPKSLHKIPQKQAIFAAFNKSNEKMLAFGIITYFGVPPLVAVVMATTCLSFEAMNKGQWCASFNTHTLNKHSNKCLQCIVYKFVTNNKQAYNYENYRIKKRPA